MTHKKDIFNLAKYYAIVTILFWCQSFTTIDGKQITLEEIKINNNIIYCLFFRQLHLVKIVIIGWLAK